MNTTTLGEELDSYIGVKGNLPVGRNRAGGYDLTVRVIVRDVRLAFGRIDLLVEPLAGTGSKWVNQANIELDRAGI